MGDLEKWRGQKALLNSLLRVSEVTRLTASVRYLNVFCLFLYVPSLYKFQESRVFTCFK